MTTKRKRKKAAPDRSAALLREKMVFILYGANGGYQMSYFDQKPDERGSFVAEVGLDTFGRWLGAIQTHLTFVTDEQRAFIARPRMLDKYDDFDAAVAWLYELGVRA